MAKVKNLGFAIEEKLHKKMKLYLLQSRNGKTIKDYVTELIENNLKDKKVYGLKNKKGEKEYE